MNPDIKFRTAQGHFWKKNAGRARIL